MSKIKCISVEKTPTRICDLQNTLESMFIGVVKTKSTEYDICMFIREYIRVWAVENNISSACSEELIDFFQKTIKFE